MNRKHVLAIAAALILCVAVLYFYAGHGTPAGQPALTELTPQTFTKLETAFNTAKDDVRVILLLSPT